MRTPVGHESVLHRAGLREVPGTGSFEFPADLSRIDAGRAQAGLTEEESAARRRARKHAIAGFIVVGIIMLAILFAGMLVSAWFGGSGQPVADRE